MFRDADWEAPTWGVVDAAWVPKKAYRAYVESNHAVRVSLPEALRAPVRLSGDEWLPAGAAVIVANDTVEPLPGAVVEIWVEDAGGARLEGASLRLTADLPAGAGAVLPTPTPLAPGDLSAGTWFLRARISDAGGQVRSTNSYEVVVPDGGFAWLDSLPTAEVAGLLDGASGVEGFHYWHGGAVTHRARPGLRGLIAGWSQVEAMGVDLYETIQGEHLFRHLLAELSGVAGADRVLDDVWTIRAEVISPEVKSRTLLRYVQALVLRAEAVLATPGRRPSRRARSTPAPPPFEASPFPAVGRDLKPLRAGPRRP